MQNSSRLTPNQTLPYTEKFRPQFHFSPPTNWLNDPNGLVYVDGLYHLYYQHNPNDLVWGDIHWGHATSKDLVHWTNHDPAIKPGHGEHELIFSGGAIIDEDNCSELGATGEKPLIAFYTMAGNKGENQRQCVSYSLDSGNTWNRYSKNPILELPGKKDFRDPKVFWHQASDSWIMLIAAGHSIYFYRSKNLLDWEWHSSFGERRGAHGGEWECPDLFQVTDKSTGQTAWALIVSISPGGPNGGSATQYFIGDFNGYQFESPDRSPKWLDWGPDNYAGVTWESGKSAPIERTMIAWMSNWLYALKVPTSPWRGQMTLPRTIGLRTFTDGEFRLVSQPINALKKLRKSSNNYSSYDVGKGGKQTVASIPECFEMKLKITVESNTVFAIRMSDGKQSWIELCFDMIRGALMLDRSTLSSQQQVPNYAFAYSADLILSNYDQLELHIFKDRSSIEVFVQKGEVCMTGLVLSVTDLISLEYLVFSGSANFNEATIYELNSIWE